MAGEKAFFMLLGPGVEAKSEGGRYESSLRNSLSLGCLSGSVG